MFFCFHAKNSRSFFVWNASCGPSTFIQCISIQTLNLIIRGMKVQKSIIKSTAVDISNKNNVLILSLVVQFSQFYNTYKLCCTSWRDVNMFLLDCEAFFVRSKPKLRISEQFVWDKTDFHMLCLEGSREIYRSKSNGWWTGLSQWSSRSEPISSWLGIL